jgi:glutathione S-transferase
MNTILYSPASPYSAKVRMAAAHAGFAAEGKVVVTADDPADLIDANPLGKIPALVMADGRTFFDSPVIMAVIDAEAKAALYPKNAIKRISVMQREALADGICDCLIAYMYEIRLRPEGMRMQAIMDRQLKKALRGLDALCAAKLTAPAKIDAGHIAVRAMIGYLDLRFAGKWEKGRKKLQRFAAAFDARHPELAKLAPHA